MITDTNSGLRLCSEEAVRVAVGLCIPHTCQCGAEANAQGGHAMVCKMAPGKTARHPSWDWLSMVLRLRQRNIGYTADDFYRSDDPTNSVKALKEGG